MSNKPKYDWAAFLFSFAVGFAGGAILGIFLWMRISLYFWAGESALIFAIVGGMLGGLCLVY